MYSIETEERALKETAPSRDGVYKMFNRISPRYDLLNHLLSFGQDIVWRRKAVKYLQKKPGQKILDLACGTGDFALTACRRLPPDTFCIGLDMAGEMLKIARQKIFRHRIKNQLLLSRGDCMAIPMQNKKFDAALMAFGLRNMTDPAGCLREINRVLKPKGRLILLEFSIPENLLFRAVYLFYFRTILPALGQLLSGDAYAYRYLNRTVETSIYGEALCKRFSACGFGNIHIRPLTFGIATIYVGDKTA